MRKIIPPFLVLFCLFAREAQACSCGRWPTPAEATHRASSVFEGVVESKSPVLASWQGYWFVVERWTFQVERAWKSPARERVITQGYSNCSLIYSLGERAVVYAYPHESRSGELETHHCGTPRGSPEEQRLLLSKPTQIYASRSIRQEHVVHRELRHMDVYLLMALAAAHNVFTRTDMNLWRTDGYVVLTAAGFALASIVGCAFARRRRRFLAMLSVCAVLLTLAVSLAVGWSNTRDGFFGHLVEYECLTCPGS